MFWVLRVHNGEHWKTKANQRIITLCRLQIETTLWFSVHSSLKQDLDKEEPIYKNSLYYNCTNVLYFDVIFDNIDYVSKHGQIRNSFKLSHDAKTWLALVTSSEYWLINDESSLSGTNEICLSDILPINLEVKLI